MGTASEIWADRDVRCRLMVDGRRRVSPRFVFRGYDPSIHGPHVEPYLDEEGLLPGRFAALLVEHDEGPTLVDAGAGRFAGEIDAGHLLDELHEIGIAPEDVRLVLITHGHADHVGGLLDPAGAPVFANARHVMHVAEVAYWASDEAARLPGDAAAPARAALAALDPAGLLEPIEGSARIARPILAIEAAGHTPGHLAVLLGEGFLWAGDAIVARLNVTHPEWVSAADMDAAQSEATRRAILGKAADAGLMMGGSHLLETLRVRRAGAGSFVPG